MFSCCSVEWGRTEGTPTGKTHPYPLVRCRLSLQTSHSKSNLAIHTSKYHYSKLRRKSKLIGCDFWQILRIKGRATPLWWYPAFARLLFRVVLSQNLLQTKNVPEPFLIENWVRVRTVWWTVQDSNLWPPARQADALPAELTVHKSYRLE